MMGDLVTMRDDASGEAEQAADLAPEAAGDDAKAEKRAAKAKKAPAMPPAPVDSLRLLLALGDVAGPDPDLCPVEIDARDLVRRDGMLANGGQIVFQTAVEVSGRLVTHVHLVTGSGEVRGSSALVVPLLAGEGRAVAVAANGALFEKGVLA